MTIEVHASEAKLYFRLDTFERVVDILNFEIIEQIGQILWVLTDCDCFTRKNLLVFVVLRKESCEICSWWSSGWMRCVPIVTKRIATRESISRPFIRFLIPFISCSLWSNNYCPTIQSLPISQPIIYQQNAAKIRQPDLEKQFSDFNCWIHRLLWLKLVFQGAVLLLPRSRSRNGYKLGKILAHLHYDTEKSPKNL